MTLTTRHSLFFTTVCTSLLALQPLLGARAWAQTATSESGAERGQRIVFPPAPQATQPPMLLPVPPAAPASPTQPPALPTPVTTPAPATVDVPAAPITTPAPAPANTTPSAKTKAPVTHFKVKTVGNLWDRIRGGFMMPDLRNDLVTNREQWYTSKPDYMARMTERSNKYLYHIVEELEARKMPTELALLPFIESAFNPQAVSSAKAAGMWQFIPSTGRSFALKQSVFRDDRRDVQASTRAALDYLQKLYGMFNDWHLALAAYNWGEGSVGRAIAKNQRLGLGTSYLDLTMPNETQYYVPKLQAIKNIVANPEAFNTRLPPIEDHPYFQSVSISKDIDVALAAKLAEVPLQDFKALNPSASRPVILAAGTPQLLLPWNNAEVFSSNLANYSGQLASWTAWVAPASLKVGEAAKRIGMNEQVLREVNHITIKNGIIKAGSSLLIPRSARKTEDVTAHVADNGHLSVTAPPKAKGRKKGSKASAASSASVKSTRKASRASAKVASRKKR